MTLEIVLTGGVIAAVSAYILFKIKDSNNPIVSSLQPLFFFMIMASFIIMGSASFQSSNDCEYLLMNVTDAPSTVHTYEYEYTCTSVAENAGSWSYRLPLWFGYFGSGYVVIYLLFLVAKVIRENLGGRGRE